MSEYNNSYYRTNGCVPAPLHSFDTVVGLSCDGGQGGIHGRGEGEANPGMHPGTAGGPARSGSPARLACHVHSERQPILLSILTDTGHE